MILVVDKEAISSAMHVTLPLFTPVVAPFA
jgi:hypothetical protein